MNWRRQSIRIGVGDWDIFDAKKPSGCRTVEKWSYYSIECEDKEPKVFSAQQAYKDPIRRWDVDGWRIEPPKGSNI